MAAFIFIILIILGVSCIPLISKRNFPKFEKLIIKFIIGTLIIYVIYIVLLTSDIRIQGRYSAFIIGGIYIFLNLLYFAIARINRNKIIVTLILTPIIFLSVIQLAFGSQVVSKYKVNELHSINVCRGGILSCGDIIEITEPKFLIFDKVIFQDSSLCLSDIDKIEVVSLNKDQWEFLIFHNAQDNSENPYKYTPNLW